MGTFVAYAGPCPPRGRTGPGAGLGLRRNGIPGEPPGIDRHKPLVSRQRRLETNHRRQN